jgi:hypothetical protein
MGKYSIHSVYLLDSIRTFFANAERVDQRLPHDVTATLHMDKGFHLVRRW